MSDKVQSGGMGCLTVIGIVLTLLKLLAIQPVAGWSWWLVLAPFYMPAMTSIAFLAVLLIIIMTRK